MVACTVVYELQPDIKWNKGNAVVWLLEKLVVPPVRGVGQGLDGIVVGADKSGRDGPENGGGDGGDDDDGVFTIFIGDDKTDENAFKVFMDNPSDTSSSGQRQCGRPYPYQRHHAGIGILVSEESRETNAAYTLKNPVEVAEFLSRLVTVGRERHLLPVNASSESHRSSSVMSTGTLSSPETGVRSTASTSEGTSSTFSVLVGGSNGVIGVRE
ncbi:unnamed protein product [Choristocarpus tenellus]